MPVSDSLLERLIADSQDRPLPTIVPREVRLPDVPGKANVLVGMRRSGKTYRLFSEMRSLLDAGMPRTRMLYLNLEDDRLGSPDTGTLDQALEAFFRRDPGAREGPALVLLDEIQVVPEWDRFVRRVLDTERVRLAITGSSARLLTTDVSTAFRGRGITTEILPFSPSEAALADGMDLPGLLDPWPPGAAQRSAMDAFLADYLRTGGFPAVRSLHPLDRIQILQEYVSMVVLRDVAERHSAANLPVLRTLASALFASNARGFSVSRLHGALVSQGWKVNKGTLLSYLDHLVDAFLVFLVPLRTRSARQQAVNLRKVYAVDVGLAAAMYRGGALNLGSQLENAVYLRLRRRYGRLSDGAIGWHRTASGKEVDFAVDDPVEASFSPGDGRQLPPTLIQVCASLRDDETRQREVEALTEALAETGGHDATIVTLNEEGTLPTPAGLIRVVPAREWFFRHPGGIKP